MFTRLLALSLVLSAATTPVLAQWEWVDVSNSNASNDVRVEDLAVDEVNDFVYSVGYVSGNNSFTGLPSSLGGDDGFVVKYDLAGNIVWGFLLGGTGNDRIHGVAIDPNTNNILVTGFVTGSSATNAVDFQGASPGASSAAVGSVGGEDAFVACYNVFGQLLWHRIVGGTNADRGLDITTNSTGAFITGFYTNTAGLSGISTIIPSNGIINNFVLAVNPLNGTTIWNSILASDGNDYVTPNNDNFVNRAGITADANGVYLVTYFNGTVYQVYNSSNVLSASLTDVNVSNEDFVVTSYTNAGVHNWSNLNDNLGTVVYGLDITNDCSGVYVSGTLHNSSTTSGGTTISSVHDNFLLSKLNKGTGAEIWLKSFKSNFDHVDHFVGIDVDDFGNLYAAGRLRGTDVVLGTDLNYSSGQAHSEVMIAHFFTDGTFQDFEVLSGTSGSWAMSVATYKDEKYVIGGFYNDDLYFGSIWSGVGSKDGFVALKNRPELIDYTSTYGYEFSGSPVFCKSELTAIPDLNVPGGGTFSGPAQVVFNDASTGEIDLISSTPGGPYTITYSGSAFVCSASPIEATIFIGVDEDASFTYIDDHFCSNAPNVLPTSIATAGGTFTAPAGLVLANASTGEIDVASSTVGGPYWLVYTTSALYCSDSDSLEIYIDAVPDPAFGYDNSNYCSGSGTISPTFVTTPGGVFSGPAEVIFVSTATGEIDLDASTVGGPYSIQYLVSNGSCTNSFIFDITIEQQEDASFSYAATTLCNGGSNVLPSSISTPGGMFFAPTGLTVANASTGEIEVSTSTVGGPYQLYYTTSGVTCSDTDSLEFTIIASVDPTFTYAQSNYCSGTGTVLPSSVASPGGTFSGPAGVVFVSTTTGEIDLDASIVGGPYVIQYVTPASPCQDSTTFSLTIDPSEDASFTYAAASFCNNEPNPVPTSITTPGGTFSAPAGLVLANTSTGEIDVAASTVGTPYYLVYTTSGATCPNSDSILIIIEDAPDPSFSYAQAVYCNNETNPVPSSITTAGGTFTAPAGLVINASTGEIDLAASTVGGPYTIQYLVTNTYCADSTTFNVTINAAEDASFTYAASNFCQNETNPVPSSITTPGGTFSGQAGLVVVSATGEIDVTASTAGGPYWLVYTTSGPTCPNSDSIQVNIEDVPDASFAFAQSTYCNSETNPVPSSITTLGGTFTAPAGLVINASTGEVDLAASTVGGPYTIQYLLTNTYCADSTTFNVTINAAEDASFTYAASNFCQNETNPVPSSITTPGGTFSGQAGLVVISATGEIDVTASTIGGPYWLVYTTGGVNCPDSDSIQVYIEDAPDPSFAYSQVVFCSGSGTVLPSSVATPGGTFTGPAGVVFVNATTGEIDLNASTVGGPYTIQYLASNSYCQDSATFSLTIDPSEDASFTYAIANFCINEPNPVPTAIATAGGTFSGPVELVFANASTGEIDVTASTIGGPYWLVYTTGGVNCPDSDSIQVYIEDAPDPSFAYSQTVFCSGSGTVLPSSVATSGGTFTGPAGVVFVNATTGEIDLNASTVGGPYTIQYYVWSPYCQDSATFSLTIDPSEDASFAYAATNFCNNEPNPVPTSVATAGGTFTGPTELVFANASTGEINVSASTVGGPYYLVYTTSGASCGDSDSIQVYIEDAPDPSFTYAQSAYCTGTGTVSPNSVATPGGTFTGPAEIVFVNATTGEIDLNASVAGGPYTIQYVASNGFCEDSTTFGLSINLTSDASFTFADDHFCVDEPNPLPVSIATSGGVFSGPIELVFVDVNTGEINAAASTIGGPYSLIYTIGGICPSTDTLEIYIEATPDASFMYPQVTYCQTGTVLPSSIALPGGVFSGSPEIVFLNTTTGEIDLAASTAGGPYIIQYSVANTYCEDSATISIIISPFDDASFTYATDHFCKNDANPIPTSIATPGGSFSASTGLVINSGTGEIDVLASNAGGPYYVVYTTIGSQCPSSDSVEVYIENAPDPSFSYAQSSYCEGSGTVLPNSVVTTGGTFSGPAGLILNASTGEIDISASTVGGPYTIQYLVTNTYCEKSATFNITIVGQDALTSVDYSSSDFCISDGNQIPVVTGTTGGIFTGPTSIDIVDPTTGEFSPSTSVVGGPYVIQYLTSGTCPDSIEVLVEIYDLLSAYAGEDQQLYFLFNSALEGDVPLNGSGEWSTVSTGLINDELDPSSDVSNLSLGENPFVWTVSNDVCPSVSDEVIIFVEELFVPQAVTPNGDGKNDFFDLQSLDEVTCSLKIFNRWGQLVYENSEYQNEWNGQNMNGKELKNDTYFYTILINDSLSFNGYVVLKK